MTIKKLEELCAKSSHAELQTLLAGKRAELNCVREELNVIEQAIAPHNVRAAAEKKLARAGLSEAELKALTVKG